MSVVLLVLSLAAYGHCYLGRWIDTVPADGFVTLCSKVGRWRDQWRSMLVTIMFACLTGSRAYVILALLGLLIPELKEGAARARWKIKNAQVLEEIYETSDWVTEQSRPRRDGNGVVRYKCHAHVQHPLDDFDRYIEAETEQGYEVLVLKYPPGWEDYYQCEGNNGL
jgi:hypothetical protein